MRTNHHGDTILAKTFGNKPVVNRIWEVSGDVIYVCSDRQFELLSSGDKNTLPLGFNIKDIYNYDPGIDLQNIDWNKATPFRIEHAE